MNDLTIKNYEKLSMVILSPSALMAGMKSVPFYINGALFALTVNFIEHFNEIYQRDISKRYICLSD